MEKKISARKERAAQTRRRIVQSAKELIAKKGFEETSIEDIAAGAGVSIGSFYTYFKRKEDVIEELSKTDFYRLAEIANGMEEAALLQRLKFYCREFLLDIEKTGIEICRQWLKNNLSPVDMLIGGEKITKYSFDRRAMEELLQEAVRREELRSDTPVDELSLLINAELYGLMVIWCMTDGEVKGSQKTEYLCDNLLAAALEKYQV